MQPVWKLLAMDLNTLFSTFNNMSAFMLLISQERPNRNIVNTHTAGPGPGQQGHLGP